MSGHCELCGETGGHSAACVSNPYQAANQRVIIATLTADLARLTAELERKQRECEGLRGAMTAAHKQIGDSLLLTARDTLMAAIAAEKEQTK